jgi:hypothetical protein
VVVPALSAPIADERNSPKYSGDAPLKECSRCENNALPGEKMCDSCLRHTQL